MKKTMLLCILDGCGIAPKSPTNAFDNAKTPTLDYLKENYPHTILEASGQPVGLPKGQMGTSEVGHMNIGAGRICYQSLEMINKSIETGEFYQNENLLKVMNHVKENNSKSLTSFQSSPFSQSINLLTVVFVVRILKVL